MLELSRDDLEDGDPKGVRFWRGAPPGKPDSPPVGFLAFPDLVLVRPAFRWPKDLLEPLPAADSVRVAWEPALQRYVVQENAPVFLLDGITGRRRPRLSPAELRRVPARSRRRIALAVGDCLEARAATHLLGSLALFVTPAAKALRAVALLDEA